MINCLFENQKDDATNIHGIYPMITEINGNKVILKLMHSQQHGFDFIKPGMTMEFVDRESLITYGEAKVASVVRLNKEYTEVSFAGELPGGVKPKDPVASIDAYPEVLIKGCTMRNNRARGLLLGSRGKTVIEDNFFHIPGASILFEGDGSYWYEQSGVREVMIRNNVFENCMYGYFNWGSATIATGSGIRKDREISRYNRNITVEGNIFRGFDPRLVNLYCVDGFIFRNNTIEKTDDYPADKANSEAIITRYCDNILIEK